MDDNLFQLLLFDRVEKIKTENKKFDFENNAYLSFSGGKDSTVLHHLIDMALPNNNIPRLFINTGIEHKDIRAFVKKLKDNDKRVNIVNSNQNFKEMFKKYGYPFKSKEHSKKINLYQNGSNSEWVKNYIDFDRVSRFKCPKKLRVQLQEDYHLKISDKCCYKLKKEPAHKWSKENKRSIVFTGERMSEGGQRANATACLVFDSKDRLTKFKPLNPLDDLFIEEFIKRFNIELCLLYYPPYNFERTGCMGCPFSLNLSKQLDVMKEYLPNEYKQCEILWKDVYSEYRRLNYRLKEITKLKQVTIFDFEKI